MYDKNMKKVANRFLLVFISCILLLSMISLVSAVSLGETLKTVISDNLVKPFGPDLQNFIANEPVFVKTLFFLLVLILVSSITALIPLFKERRFLSFVFGLVVSILAVYFIPKGIVSAMLNPYTALGVAMISVVPFVIMVVFTRYFLTNTFLKKVAWLFFAVMMVVFMIYTSITNTVGVIANKGAGFNGLWMSWIYGAVSVLAIVMLFFNKAIDKAIWHGKLETVLKGHEEKMGRRKALDVIEEQEAVSRGLPTR